MVDLPPPVGPTTPDHLARLDGEAHIAQHRTARIIGEGHVIEDDFPVNRLLAGIRLFGKDGVRVEDGPDAFHRHCRLGNGVIHAGQVFHRLEK